MADNYEYPLIEGLSVTELSDLIGFYNVIEQAYENPRGIERNQFQTAYNKFRAVIPSQMEQKQLERRFAEESGLDAYQAIKQLNQTEASRIKVGDING